MTRHRYFSASTPCRLRRALLSIPAMPACSAILRYGGDGNECEHGCITVSKAEWRKGNNERVEVLRSKIALRQRYPADSDLSRVTFHWREQLHGHRSLQAH